MDTHDQDTLDKATERQKTPKSLTSDINVSASFHDSYVQPFIESMLLKIDCKDEELAEKVRHLSLCRLQLDQQHQQY